MKYYSGLAGWLLALICIHLTASAGAETFGPPLPPESPGFHLFESGHVRPLCLSPSGRFLFAVNTPGNSLHIFQARQDGSRKSLKLRGTVFTGLEPVAVTALSETIVFVVNHLSDSVSVVDTSNPDKPFVSATLQVGDEPQDAVLAGRGKKWLFITTAHRGQHRPGPKDHHIPGTGRADVWIFNTENLKAKPRIITLFCDKPRALAVSPDGGKVYAAAFLSGNRTTVIHFCGIIPKWNDLIADGFMPHGPPPPHKTRAGVQAPTTGLIVQKTGERWLDEAGRDWTPRVRLNLPDNDIFVIDATAETPGVVEKIQGVGTTIFNLAVHPRDGTLYASNLKARNLVRFKPVLCGHLIENQVTVIQKDRVRPVHLNPHIDYRKIHGPLAEREKSLALPMGMTWHPRGDRLYLCAMGSGKVAVLDRTGKVTQRIPVGRGPTGSALNAGAGKLYVMNRIDHSIAILDLATHKVTDTVPLPLNPEPRFIREGRAVFYDAFKSSGHGDHACASCHIFGDRDGLAWDFGDPGGTPWKSSLPRVPTVSDIPHRPFHPMKGPMTTLTFRGLKEAGAMHWRGDTNGCPDKPYDHRLAFMAHQISFKTLLGRETELPASDMEKLCDFVLALRYPPNPVANIDGTFTPHQAAGKRIFDSDGNPNKLGGSGTACWICHTLPLGTSRRSAPGMVQDLKVPHLRGLYQKIGMVGYVIPGVARIFPYKLDPRPTPHMGDQVRGFGFSHDGAIPTMFDFFRRPFGHFAFKDEPGGPTGTQKIRQLEAYLMTFPTGLAPVVGQQVTLDRTNLADSAAILTLLSARAKLGEGGLLVQGRIGGKDRTWHGNAALAADRFLDMVKAGAVLTATVLPPGN